MERTILHKMIFAEVKLDRASTSCGHIAFKSAARHLHSMAMVVYDTGAVLFLSAPIRIKNTSGYTYGITMIVVNNTPAQPGYILVKLTVPDHNIAGMIVKNTPRSRSAFITGKHTLLQIDLLAMIEVHYASTAVRLIVDKLTSY